MSPAGATRVAAGAMLRQALGGAAERAGPHLLVRGPGGLERAVALQGELVIGRGGHPGLELEDPAASRRHARLLLDEAGAATVEDLGSRNGLTLNGRRVRGTAALRPGDELLVGRTSLRYLDPLLPAPALPAPGAGGPAGEVKAPGQGAAPTGPAQGPTAWALLAGASALLAAAALALAAGAG